MPQQQRSQCIQTTRLGLEIARGPGRAQSKSDGHRLGSQDQQNRHLRRRQKRLRLVPGRGRKVGPSLGPAQDESRRDLRQVVASRSDNVIDHLALMEMLKGEFSSI